MDAGVVLAAGASTRFGSPKALALVAGEAAVARAARILRESGCEPVVVVLGAKPEAIRGAVPAPARVVVNADWIRGRTGTVKAGVRAVRAGRRILVWPVDHPAVAPETVRALVAGRGAVRVPTQGGKRGHPTLFDAALRDELLALADDEPLHDVLHADPGRVVEVPVEDAGIHLNLDTPEDLERLDAHLRRTPRARPAP